MPNIKKSIKKVATKKATKKVSKDDGFGPVLKKALPPKDTVPIKEATPEQCFWVNNGPICKTHADLKKALKTMSQAQYAYHTKGDHNDFSNWMEEVMGHHTCAVKLKKTRTKEAALKVLENCTC